MCGPHAGLILMATQRLWSLLGADLAEQVRWIRLKEPLVVLADWMVEQKLWRDYEVVIDASTNPPDRNGVGLIVRVQHAGVGPDYWAGRFTITRDDRVLRIDHLSHGHGA